MAATRAPKASSCIVSGTGRTKTSILFVSEAGRISEGYSIFIVSGACIASFQVRAFHRFRGGLHQGGEWTECVPKLPSTDWGRHPRSEDEHSHRFRGEVDAARSGDR